MDLAAGVALSLLMIKPHVAYLFWPVAIFWAWRHNRWRVVIGWLAALVGASAVAVLAKPNVFGGYLGAASEGAVDWATPTLGFWMRRVVGLEHRWLQFLPSVAMGAVTLVWLLRRRGAWRWEEVAPILLLPSSSTSVYSWSNDQLILFPVVVALVSRQRRGARWRLTVAAGVWAASQVGLLLVNQHQMGDHWTVWHPVVLAGLFWWSMRAETGGGSETIVDRTE